MFKGLVNLTHKAIKSIFNIIKKDHLEELEFDKKYAIDTSGYFDITDHVSDNYMQKHGHDYQGTPLFILESLLGKIPENHYQNMTFIDFGSGLGRCLFAAIEAGFSKAIGIEFCEDFYKLAIRNIKTCNLHDQDKHRIQVINMDAVDFHPPQDDIVFFFFNPFSSKILAEVATNIILSQKNSSGDLYVIYYNPWYREVFDEIASYELIDEGHFGRLWQSRLYYEYVIYRLKNST